jgi:ABC-type transport system substrate-binding protein
MVQFAWSASLAPPCFLFLSDEVPGAYPDHPKGWGGGNLTGYSNPDFDQYCHQAGRSIPGSDPYIEGYHQSQFIFSEDLPVIPLYQRFTLNAMRTDMCGIDDDLAASNSVLSYIELFDYGNHCE